jgi:2-polyprenyl-6-hydroxyphenyl methylase/3-demethylubiquinone-9 3-methyltransferase
MEKSTCAQAVINNEFYETLRDQWYTADDHPIALLRAENRLRAPWVEKEIRQRLGDEAKVLDIGCGGGFLSNHLAKSGFQVTGIDLSQESLAIAKKYDETGNAHYLQANGYQLPFEAASFDVTCAMDILEHVEEPLRLIQEASRVLRPGGLFFFHTFNRNLLSRLIVIYGVDWFVKNAPKNMHVYPLFIKPAELTSLCGQASLQVLAFHGFAPNPFSFSFWQLLWSRRVPKDFKFSFTNNLTTGYCGLAIKNQ